MQSKNPFLKLFFFGSILIGFSGAQSQASSPIEESVDLLDMPYGSRVVLTEDLSFAESASKEFRAIFFQKGVLLKKKQNPSKKAPYCTIAARVPGTALIRKSETLILCAKDFLNNGNGKVYLEYQNRRDCDKAPGIAVICEAETEDRDLLVRDLKAAVGSQFQWVID